MNKIAERLRAMRESVGLSQAKIAKLISTTQTSINRYENGQASPPVKVFLWYADFFDVSLDYIFGRTDTPEGKLYEHKPKVLEAMTESDKELKQFIDMCFDPVSPVSHKLKEVLTEMLKEQKQ